MSNPLSVGYHKRFLFQREQIEKLTRDRDNLLQEFKAAIEAKATLNAAPTEMVEDAASLEFWAAFDRLAVIVAEIEGRVS